jgi:hypothetical protein
VKKKIFLSKKKKKKSVRGFYLMGEVMMAIVIWRVLLAIWRGTKPQKDRNQKQKLNLKELREFYNKKTHWSTSATEREGKGGESLQKMYACI